MKKYKGKKEEPSTVIQLAAAMQALGLYNGQNTEEEHQAAAARIGGQAYHHMLLVNALLGAVETEALYADSSGVKFDQMQAAHQQALKIAGAEDTPEKLMNFLRWRTLRVFSISFWLLAKGALHHAAREGVRFAITAKTLPGLAHDESIKQVVRDNAFGLLSAQGQTDAVIIEYFGADGSGATAVNGAGNIVRVSIRNYTAPRLVSAILFFLPDSITLNVSSVDKMEPYPGSPPART